VIASLRSIWILLGALALGVALACGGDTEDAAPAAEAPAAAWEPGAAPKVPSSPAVWTTELPADFPADVPLYPGAQVVQARVSPDQETAVTLSVEDDAEAVSSFYADSFAAEGWSTETVPGPGGSAIFADKIERRVSTMVRSTDEGTEIDLVIIRVR
jgi:hypothetical protein